MSPQVKEILDLIEKLTDEELKELSEILLSLPETSNQSN